MLEILKWCFQDSTHGILTLGILYMIIQTFEPVKISIKNCNCKCEHKEED